jgi:Flp pilus assembly protein TadD
MPWVLAALLVVGHQGLCRESSGEAGGAHAVRDGSQHAAASTRDPSGFVIEATELKREAVLVASKLAAAYPDDALTSALLGSAYYNIGQSGEATKHLQRCIALNPKQADAYEMLARIAYEKGEPEESARLCHEALKHGPSGPEVLNQLGRALMDQGKTEEAVRTLQKATQLPQAPSESHYLLGQACLQSGNPAQAKQGFLRAVSLAPDHTQAVFGLFTACQRLGEPDEAARYRAQFQQLEAQDRQALNDRSAQEDTRTGLPLVRKTVARTIFGAAQIHRAHQQPDEAGRLFYRAASLDPDQPSYRAALESHYVQRKSLAEGVSAFEKLAAEQPGNHLNFLFLGRLHGRLQQVDEAERDFRKVQELAPAWSEGYRALAELFLRAGRQLPEALALARKAVELAPTAPHYHLLAAVSAENKDRAGAVAAMKQAVTLDPGRAMYREFLQKLQEAPSQ